MEPVRSKFSKRGNVNIPWAKVGRRVFCSLQDAEKYCSAHGLNPDDWIEYGDSEELKLNIQEIARMQKPILTEVMEQLDARKNALSKKQEMYSAQLKTCHPLDRGYLEDQIRETGAKIGEACDCWLTVSKIKETLEWLTGWHD